MAVVRHKEAIHSGHFMISNFEAEAQDDEENIAVPVLIIFLFHHLVLLLYYTDKNSYPYYYIDEVLLLYVGEVNFLFTKCNVFTKDII